MSGSMTHEEKFQSAVDVRLSSGWISLSEHGDWAMFSKREYDGSVSLLRISRALPKHKEELLTVPVRALDPASRLLGQA